MSNLNSPNQSSNKRSSAAFEDDDVSAALESGSALRISDLHERLMKTTSDYSDDKETLNAVENLILAALAVAPIRIRRDIEIKYRFAAHLRERASREDGQVAWQDAFLATQLEASAYRASERLNPGSCGEYWFSNSYDHVIRHMRPKATSD